MKRVILFLLILFSSYISASENIIGSSMTINEYSSEIKKYFSDNSVNIINDSTIISILDIDSIYSSDSIIIHYVNNKINRIDIYNTSILLNELKCYDIVFYLNCYVYGIPKTIIKNKLYKFRFKDFDVYLDFRHIYPLNIIVSKRTKIY